MKAAIYCEHPHQRAWAERMRDGLRRHGVTCGDRDMTEADFAVSWGVRNRHPFNHHPHVLVLERAYLGDRFSWLSLGWNGLNGRAEFCNEDVPDDRWRRYWRDQAAPASDGEDVLLIGQVRGDMSIQGVHLSNWLRDVTRNLDEQGIRWAYRPHPEAGKRGQKEPCPADPRPLDQALAECRRVITYNSNVGVLAAMAGKRLTVENDGAMAYEVAGHGWQVDQPLGDRDEWGRKLAYCQWRPEELTAGDFWPTLKRVL